MPERGRSQSSSPSRRWMSWNTPEGEKALRRFAERLDRVSRYGVAASARIESDPYYRHGFGLGWVLADEKGEGEPVALLWAGFDEWEVQRRRRPLGLFGLRLHPDAAFQSGRIPTPRELRVGLEHVSRFLRSRAVTDAVGPVQIGFHRDSGWGVRSANDADTVLWNSLREASLSRDRIARRVRLSVRELQSAPPFLADVELARDGGRVGLGSLARRPLWRGVRLSTDPLLRIDAGEWVRLSALAVDSRWDLGFAEAVPPSPQEWMESARAVGAGSFLRWSRWIEVAGETAGFIFAWKEGETLRVKRVLLHERYRDFHLAPFALHRMAELAREDRVNFLELGPVPSSAAWDELLRGFTGDGGAVLSDDPVDLFVLEV